MKPGKIIHIKSKTEDNFWHVESVCLGALNQESVIHIGRCDGTKMPDCLGLERGMFVPELMLRLLIDSGIAKLYDAFEGDNHTPTEMPTY
jgi:hypothetical protein